MYKRMCCIALVLLCWASPAMAQQNDGELDQGNLLFLSSSSIAMPFLSSFTVASTAISWREDSLRDEIKRLKTIVRIQQFLEHNERQVQMSLALGGGSGLHEVVNLIDSRVPFSPALGKQLRKNRQALRLILKQPKGFDRAAGVYDVFHRVMKAHRKPLFVFQPTFKKEVKR